MLKTDVAYSRLPIRMAMVVVLVAGLVWTWVSRPVGSFTESVSAARIGAVAPDLLLQGLDGRPISLKALRGKSVVLNFWATWCPPCRAEMAAMNQVQRDLADQGVVVLGVNHLEDEQTVSRFMLAEGLSFPIALDQAGVAAQSYRVGALPTTYFIDRNGTIQDVVFGGPLAQALIESKVLNLLRP